ncbi:hypothetical protein [Anabaena sp. PCC 7108]|uniref:hypothetical protein n=1 Tax=Anabaena sp. PCC 7108 TaxID=163908 RepID=UPI00034640FF|nr:hypothetical protein [Anabaena sp. PCC 7108]
MNDTIIGFERILEDISKNNEHNLLYTHKEVRCLARSFIAFLQSPDWCEICRYDKEIKILLVSLSCRGINHYDRAFLAERIIEYLKQERQYQTSEDCF